MKIWVLWPFQEYFTYIEPIVNAIALITAKTPKLHTVLAILNAIGLIRGRQKPEYPEKKLQNLASHMYPERGSNHSSERSNV